MFAAVLQSLEKICLLNPHEQQLVTAELKPVKFKKGDYLLKEGEKSRGIFFLTYGSCIHYRNADEGMIVKNLYVPGDWITDYNSFSAQTPSQYFIQAFEDSECIELGIENLHRIIHMAPSFMKMARLMSVMNYPEYVSNGLSPLENYQKLIAEHPQIIQTFPLKYIASLLNITPETLSRVRAKLS